MIRVFTSNNTKINYFVEYIVQVCYAYIFLLLMVFTVLNK